MVIFWEKLSPPTLIKKNSPLFKNVFKNLPPEGEIFVPSFILT
jgi:hypothetical protein